ncbi:MAG: hypothetical protein HQK96_03835 [Nitrospirae bacterium]|nr:hypothetical protein [Nitrospirota bacterium]
MVACTTQNHVYIDQHRITPKVFNDLIAVGFDEIGRYCSTSGYFYYNRNNTFACVHIENGKWVMTDGETHDTISNGALKDFEIDEIVEGLIDCANNLTGK